MSSILKALKKLEEDTAPREGESREPQNQMRRVVKRRTRSPWLLNRLLPALAVGVVIAGAVWFFTLSDGTVPVNKKQAEAVEREKKAVEKPVKKTVEKAVEKAAETNRVDRKTPPPSSSLPSRDKQPEPLLHRQVPVSPSVVPPVSSPEPVKGPGKSIVSPNKPKPNLTLQGIIWSQTPEKRQALVNDRYLKEGDTIKGAEIFKIEKKSVTLRMGKQTWTIGM